MSQGYTLTALCLIGGMAAWFVRGSARAWLLLAISIAWWCFASLPALGCALAVLALTWIGARCIEAAKEAHRFAVTCASVVAVLAPLLVFKFVPIAGLQPLGISYYTFSCLGILLDLYWRKGTRPAVGDLLFLGLFFPKAEVGPVERLKSMSAQFAALGTRDWDHAKARHGAVLVAAGLLMKLVLAERLSKLVNLGFDETAQVGALASGAAILVFPWQLYFDFGGYSLAAIGLAQMMGIELRINFNRPLYAASVSEFWQRWHISLSTWFQDYIYTPVRFMLRRKRTASLVVATFASFTLIGLWHGAQLNFLVFGFIQGVLLCWETLRGKSTLPLPIRLVRTYLFVSLSLLLFRAADIHQAGTVLGACTHWSGKDVALILKALNKLDLAVLIAFVPLIEWLTARGLFDPARGPALLSACAAWQRHLLYVVLVASVLALGLFSHTPFIYARF